MFGKSGHLGAVLCRDYDNGLGDHMAIKCRDGPNSDLLSLNCSHSSLNSYVFGDVRLFRHCVMSRL